MGGIALIELFEDARLGACIHALAVVGDAHDDEGLHLHAAHLQHAALGRELDGVVDEVDPDVGHHLLVAHVAQLVQIQPQIQLLVRPLLLHQQDAVAQLLVQAVAALVGDDLLVFQLGQKQHVGGHVRKALGFGHDDAGVLLPLRIGEVVALQLLGEAPDGHDGRLELVAEVVDEVRAEQLDAAQFLGHVVVAGDQLPNLAHAVLLVEADAEVALGDLLHGVVHPMDGAQLPPAEARRQHHRKQDAQQHQQQRPQRKAHQRLHHARAQQQHVAGAGHQARVDQDRQQKEGQQVAQRGVLPRAAALLPGRVLPAALHPRFTAL